MTSEKLYALATENLECICYGYARECNMGDGKAFFEQAKKTPDVFSRYYPALAAALEIWTTAREETLKSKGGTAYTAVKRIIKNVPEYNQRLKGVWVDNCGRQCVCDGYHAVRMKNHIDGFDTVEPPIDLDNAMKADGEPIELPLPTPGELKACIAEQKGKDRKFYDFGEGLPRVDATFLKDILDILPGAKAKSYGINKLILFESDVGDGILLPVRKTA